jgi:hypothetical protein
MKTVAQIRNSIPITIVGLIFIGMTMLAAPAEAVTRQELTELFIALEVISASKAEEARSYVPQVPSHTTLLELTKLFIAVEAIPEEKVSEAFAVVAGQEDEANTYVQTGTSTPSGDYFYGTPTPFYPQPPQSIDERLNAEIVSIDVLEVDGAGVYRFKFDLTAGAMTYYISATSSNIVQFHVEDEFGSVIDTVGVGTTTVTSNTATWVNGAYAIPQGATETFVFTTTLMSTQAGSYRVVLDTLEFCESSILPYGRTHAFAPRTDFTSSYINFHPVSVVEVAVSGGRGALLNPEAHRGHTASTTPRVQLLGTTTPLHLDGGAEIKIDMPQFIELLIVVGVIPQEKAALARQRIVGM